MYGSVWLPTAQQRGVTRRNTTAAPCTAERGACAKLVLWKEEQLDY